MDEWYALTNDLETTLPCPDPLVAARIAAMAAARRPRRPLFWRLAAIAAVILLLAACGAAAFRFSDWFGSLADSHTPENDEALLASMGTVIDQSQTADGVTLTLHGAVWDGNHLFLSLSASGQAFPTGSIVSDRSWLFLSRAQYESELLADVPAHWTAEKRENALQFYDSITANPSHAELYCADGQILVQQEFSSDLDQTELTLHLENLALKNGSLAGPYEFTFTITRSHARRSFAGAARLEPEDGPAITVTRVEITPLQTQVWFTGSGTFREETANTLQLDRLLTASGSPYCSARSRTLQHNEDGSWNGSLTLGPLDRVLDPDSVTALVISGTDFPLERLTECAE